MNEQRNEEKRIQKDELNSENREREE